jgi:transmembrane sensor
VKPSDSVTPTPAQEQAAFAWLSLLHDRPSAGDQLTFSQWLRADPAHAEAYAQAQVVWELSESPARTLADEEALALQGYLDAMDRPRRRSACALVGGAGDGGVSVADGQPRHGLATAALD